MSDEAGFISLGSWPHRQITQLACLHFCLFACCCCVEM